MKLLMLILSLPTENATARMRAWRTLKASGAAVLRDGVYLMPERETCRAALGAIAADVLANGGSAHVLRAEATGANDFAGAFDRSRDYAALATKVAQVRASLATGSASDALKRTRKLRKLFQGLVDIDFSPARGSVRPTRCCAIWNWPAPAPWRPMNPSPSRT